MDTVCFEQISPLSYRDRAKAISRMTRDRQHHPMDDSLYLLEYIARTRGAQHLKVAPELYEHPLQSLLYTIMAIVAVAAVSKKLWSRRS